MLKFIDLKENTLTHSFQNHYSKRVKHPPQGFPYEDQDVLLKEGIWGVSLQTQKFELSPFVGYHPH